MEVIGNIGILWMLLLNNLKIFDYVKRLNMIVFFKCGIKVI